MVGGGNKPVLKLRDMEEKHLHNLFLKNMSGLIEEVKNPTPRLNPNSKCGGMATHAGLALELGITRKKSLSPQMEAILIWCQCRTREYDDVNIMVSLENIFFYLNCKYFLWDFYIFNVTQKCFIYR